MRQKIQRTLLIRNLLYYLFLAALVASTIAYLFFEVYFALDHKATATLFLIIFFIIGLIINVFLYYLYNKIGKGSEFLKERGLIVGLLFFVVVVGFWLIES